MDEEKIKALIEEAQGIFTEMKQLKEKYNLQEVSLQFGEGVLGIDAMDQTNHYMIGKYGDDDYNIYIEEIGRLNEEFWDLIA